MTVGKWEILQNQIVGMTGTFYVKMLGDSGIYLQADGSIWNRGTDDPDKYVYFDSIQSAIDVIATYEILGEFLV